MSFPRKDVFDHVLDGLQNHSCVAAPLKPDSGAFEVKHALWQLWTGEQAVLNNIKSIIFGYITLSSSEKER